MQDRNREIFDSHSSHYASDVDGSVAFSGLKADFFTKVKADYFKDRLRQKFDDLKALDVLDLGCGIGIFEGLFEGEFSSLTGIDVSEKSIETAKANHKQADFLVYEGSGLPFEDNSFDVVFTICVMHHVPPENWENFIKEARRVTKPNGLFAVFEHNPYNILTRHVVNNCELDEHAVLLKPKDIHALTAKVFPGNHKVEYILTVPPLFGLLKKLDRLFKYLPLGAQYAYYAEK